MNFSDTLESIGKKISSTAGTAKEKAMTTANTVSLNNKISSEESSIRAQYQAIGEKYVQLYGANGDPNFEEYIQKIGESRKRIDDYRVQIRKNKGLILCPECGAEIAETALFCTACGTTNAVGQRLAEEKAAQEAAEKAAQEATKAASQPVFNGEVCSACGKPRMAGMKFCTSCGAKFEEPTTAAPTESATNEIICSHCGKTVPAGMNFCVHCGQKLENK